MNNYELVLVLSGKTTPAKKKSVLDFVEKVVKTTGGKISDSRDLGEIGLAYKIRKNATGSFIKLVLELEGKEIKSFCDKLKSEDGIIRYLLIRN